MGLKKTLKSVIAMLLALVIIISTPLTSFADGLIGGTSSGSAGTSASGSTTAGYASYLGDA